MKKRFKSTFFVFCAFIISIVSYAQENDAQENENPKTGTGFYNNTDVGLLVGSSKNNLKAPFSFMSVTGYHITEQFAIGIGIGSEFLAESYIPIVLDLRYYFRNDNFSPYVFIQGGYSIATENEVDSYYNYGPIYYDFSSIWPGPSSTTLNPNGGFLINPGFGIRKMFSNNFGLTFSVSYRFQRLNYDENNNSHIDVDYNRMNIRMGIIFK